MKTPLSLFTVFSFFLFALSFGSVTFADTDLSTRLAATDGTQIYLAWTTHQNVDPSNSLATDTATALTITVANPQLTGSRVVIINDCDMANGGHTQNVFQCDLVAAYTSSGLQSHCTINNIFLDQHSETSGVQTSCSQQVAVVMSDNTWLVDPVNGTHNFNFSMN